MTRTANTEAQYARIFSRVVRVARVRHAERLVTEAEYWRSAASPAVAAIVSVVIECVQEDATRSRPKTVQLWRAAIDFKIRQSRVLLGEDATARLIEKLRLVRACREHLHLPHRTSSRRPKTISKERALRLIDYLRAQSSPLASATAAFFQAAVITGLRPCEWRSASLSDAGSGGAGVVLHVINAKATNGRGGGGARALSLHPQAAVWVSEHLKNVPQHEEDFHRFCNACRKWLRTARMALWGANAPAVSLYTARHQFAANAKGAGLDRASVALALGHSSELTAGRHYGKRRSGWKELQSHRHTIADEQRQRSKADAKTDCVTGDDAPPTPAPA